MTPDTDTSFSSALARVFWIMVGPLVLLLLLSRIVTNGGGWFTPDDFGFLAVLGGTILARLIEFWGGNPRTGTGEPATRADLRKYIIASLIVGLGVWILANLIGSSSSGGRQPAERTQNVLDEEPAGSLIVTVRWIDHVARVDHREFHYVPGLPGFGCCGFCGFG